MSHITEIALENYRSFRSARCRLSPFTLVVGANNAGKSNLLRAVCHVTASWTTKAEADSLKAARHHQCTKDISVCVAAKWSDDHFSEAIFWGEEERRDEIKAVLERFFASDGRNAPEVRARYLEPFLDIYHLDPTIIGGAEGGADEPRIEASGKGVSWTLDKWNSGARQKHDRFERVVDELRRCVSEIDRISFYDLRGGLRAIQVEQTGLPDPVPLSEVSDGTRIMLALLTLMNVENPPPVLLLEDIDHGLHPRLYEQLVDFLRTLAAQGRTQIIATTHNPYLIDEFREMPEAVVIVEKQDGQSTLSNLDERLKTMLEPGEELEMPLGQVWFSGLVGGVPGMKLPEILKPAHT